MHCIIPFESKIKFNYPVKEICSISLENEITKNEDELLGNFFIMGTCKEHELSINTTNFKFTLPFSVTYTNKINLDTLDFKIEDFTYELEDNNLIIKIEYALDAEDIPDIEDLNPLDLIEEVIPEEREQEEVENKKEESRENYQEEITSLTMEDDYVIYHVHFLKETDNIDTLCQRYKIDKEELFDINNITSLDGLEKVLIPMKNA